MRPLIAVLTLALCGALAVGGSAQTPPRTGSGQEYTIEQATSDSAQLNTIAFSGLAFVTGSFGADTFLPPGKIADYFGFQYMRDIQPNGAGHNTDFLTRAADNMLLVLTDAQKAQLVALGKAQAVRVNALATKRFPLIRAFRRQLAGDLPSGSTGLSKTAVSAYVAQIFALDGQLSYERAVLYGSILRGLSDTQKTALAKLEFADYSTWPKVPEQLDKTAMSHDTHVLAMTYAGDMLSWYLGSVTSDTYFCPERHGTYFGGFYMKDAPAMGKADYTIDTALTGNSGEQFLKTLTASQRARITGIVGLQRADLKQIVTVRRAISVELRKLLTAGTEDKARVLSLSRTYGALDGRLSTTYAVRFAEVAKTLTAGQRAALVKLRNLSTTPKGAFLYSEPIATPKIPSTDFLFTSGSAT